MRELTRKQRCAVNAAVNAVEHEPALLPVVVEDYGMARAEVHDLRGILVRRINALAGHVDEVGSRSAVPSRDGLAPYGSLDHTGFGEDGCVY